MEGNAMIVVTERLGVFGTNIVKFGLGYGAVAAMILSYNVNKSIL